MRKIIIAIESLGFLLVPNLCLSPAFYYYYYYF